MTRSDQIELLAALDNDLHMHRALFDNFISHLHASPVSGFSEETARFDYEELLGRIEDLYRDLIKESAEWITNQP